MTDYHWRLRWPLEGTALVVDDEEMVRSACALRLARAGCTCHVADTYEAAVEIFRRDRQIAAVILDHGVQGGDTGRFVSALRAVSPDVILVANSGAYCREEFAAVGVRRFLQKPWTTEELVDLLTDRIGDCVDCGLPTPLRRARPGESASSWVCRGCGARYRAVMDSDDAIPSHIRRNVCHPADLE